MKKKSGILLQRWRIGILMKRWKNISCRETTTDFFNPKGKIMEKIDFNRNAELILEKINNLRRLLWPGNFTGKADSTGKNHPKSRILEQSPES